ncbi:MAG: zinc-ribbon domain-containing protein [Deltaproteobacteria bacterium]|nr:zinc-ribbon domain-containing protein [Deltaproteobacteria bacterium]
MEKPIRTAKSSFFRLYPLLVAQWHPEKNLDLTPYHVTPCSRQKVWWLCEDGHEWIATVGNRVRGSRCPYCAGRLPTAQNNLAVKNPDLAREWHPTKNADLTPENFLPRSSRKVWWRCESGHEWPSTIGNRAMGAGCPYCSGRMATLEVNLARKFPEIAAQWHPTKNADLTPDRVTPTSGKTVWWQCECGHDWERTVIRRTLDNAACPYCQQLDREERSLLSRHPEIARQWHPTKNADLTPDAVSEFSSEYVWWRCERGHEWKTRVASRSLGRGCPFCSGRRATAAHNLASAYPRLAAQWHPTRNGELRPSDVTPRSNRKAWWRCGACGHEWEADIGGRAGGRGCPVCARSVHRRLGRLSQSHPNLATQWHPTRNGDLTPDRVTTASNKRVWWKCEKGHEWLAMINHRTSSPGCPYCVGKKADAEHNLATDQPELVRQWHPTKNGDLTPMMLRPKSNVRVWWVCDKGHEWQAPVIRRTNGAGCPFCVGKRIDASNSLASHYPEIARQWHPTRNGSWTPEDFAPRSDKKVWWTCGEHEWETAIKYRTLGHGCPYCAGKRVTPFNNLAVMFPDIASQWHPTKNGDLTPDQVMTAVDAYKVVWVCDNGHEWEASVQSRTKGTGCPYCTHRVASAEYNLALLDRRLARQWHPAKNGELTPFDVTPHSMKKVWWICKEGHSWRARIHNRSAGSGCFECSPRRPRHRILKSDPPTRPRRGRKPKPRKTD